MHSESDIQPWASYKDWIMDQTQIKPTLALAKVGLFSFIRTQQNGAFPDPATPDLTIQLMRKIRHGTTFSHRIDFGQGGTTFIPRENCFAVSRPYIDFDIEGVGDYEVLICVVNFAELQNDFAQSGVEVDTNRLDSLFTKIHNDEKMNFFMSEIWQSLQAKSSANNEIYSQGLCSAMFAWLLRIADQSNPPLYSDSRLSKAKIKQIKECLESHLQGRVCLNTLAQEVGLSKFHLCRLYREATGETLTATLTSLRLSKAMDLLRRHGREYSLHGIALECGFSDHSHMNRHLRSAYGKSAGQIVANYL
jgi:AraC-like DNA-binding protein